MDENQLHPYRISTVTKHSKTLFTHISGFNVEHVLNLIVASLKTQTEVEGSSLTDTDEGFISYRNGDGDLIKIMIEKETNLKEVVQ